MRKLFIMMCAAPLLALSACSGMSPLDPNAGPSSAADSTTLDEKAGITAETAYAAASTLGAKLALAGLIDKGAFKALDARAYQAVQAERAAYAAGNSPGYIAAIEQINALVTDIKALAQGSN